MISTLVSALFLAGVSPGVQIDVGRIDRSALPLLRTAKRDLPTANMVGDVEKMLSSGMCRFSGQSPTDFDITVPYAVLIEPDGKTRRVVVQDVGCSPLESYVGLLVLELARQGDFARSVGPKPLWYASEINFNLQ